MKNRKHYFSGIILALTGCVSLGVLGIIDKIGTVQNNNPLVFSVQSLFISLLFTIAFALIYFQGKLSSNVEELSFSSWGLIILIGLLASGLTILFRFIGLIESTGTFATLSQIITTSLTAMLAWIFLKEKLSKVFWGLFAIIIASTYFVSVGKVGIATVKTGDLFIIFGTFFLATGNILSGIAIKKVDPILVSAGRFLFGFISLLIISFALAGNTIFTFSSFWVILSGLFWSVSVITFNLALKRIGVTFITALLMLAPIITMVLEYSILKNYFNPVQITAAFVVVICGIAIIFTRSARKLR